MEVLRGRDIGRTIQLTYAKGFTLNEETGELDPCEYVLYGAVSRDKAQRYIRRHTGDDGVVIQTVEVDTDYYAMDLQTFLTNAVKREG